MDAQNIIDAAISGNMDAVKTAFDSTIAAKVTDALDVKKVEIASTLLGTEEETPNETETIEVEVDGTEFNDVGSTVDASSEDA